MLLLLLLLLLFERFIFCLPDCRKLSETTWSLARARLVLLATQQEEWRPIDGQPDLPAMLLSFEVIDLSLFLSLFCFEK